MHTTVRIEVNGHHHEMQHHEVSGLKIKEIGHHEHGVLYREDEHGRHKIADDEEVHLHDCDRFVIVAADVHQPITIEVDEKPYHTIEHRLTGAQIKALAKRPAGNTLYRLEGQQRIQLGDNELIELHEHERFVTFPPHGHAS